MDDNNGINTLCCAIEMTEKNIYYALQQLRYHIGDPDGVYYEMYHFWPEDTPVSCLMNLKVPFRRSFRFLKELNT